jgi:phosphate transport system protein
LRIVFQQQLENLEQDLLRMGSLVEEAIGNSVLSLARQDLPLAEQVLEGDKPIDDLEILLEEQCMQLLALQQPVAKDLRKIGTILKVTTDLERIADQATNIAELTVSIGTAPLIKPLIDIPRMANLARGMLHKSIEAFVREDEQLARDVCAQDEEVDLLYASLFEELVGFLVHRQEGKDAEQIVQLLFTARALERIADHATNIGERVVYMLTGQVVKLNGF